MHEAQIFEKLVETLLKKKYPKEALASEFYYRGRQLDFAILDPETDFPLAFFEVKYIKVPKNDFFKLSSLEVLVREQIDAQKNARAQEEQRKVYSDYLSIFKTRFFFISTNESNELEFRELSRNSDGEPALIPLDDLPSFEELRNSFPNIIKLNEEKKKKREINWLWVIAWLLAFFIVVLLVLDALCIYSLTLERLYYTVLAVLLVLAPWIVKISVLGLEIVRDKRQEKLQN